RELSGIYAQQKGNVIKDRVYDVGATTTQPLDRVARDLDYEQGRFFFAVDPALVPGYPAVDVLGIDQLALPDSLRVGSLHVYRVRAVSPISSSNQKIGGIKAVGCPPGARAVDCGTQRAGPFQWEVLQEGKDYYVDPSGAWFALASRLDQSDYLAVSYTPAGQTSCGAGRRCVGTFPVAANPDTAAPPDTLRLVYDPKPAVTAASPTFRFEIRSAYRVGGGEITRETVRLTLTVNQREKTLTTGETYLARLGVALQSDPTKFDQYNRLFPRARDPNQGAPLRDYFAVFPHLTPFADSSRSPPRSATTLCTARHDRFSRPRGRPRCSRCGSKPTCRPRPTGASCRSTVFRSATAANGSTWATACSRGTSTTRSTTRRARCSSGIPTRCSRAGRPRCGRSSRSAPRSPWPPRPSTASPPATIWARAGR